MHIQLSIYCFRPSRLSLNMAKLSSSGYTIDSTSSALTVSSRDSPSSSLSKSEAVFISSLVRPSRGSLNFLRALEASSASTTKPLDGARKSSLLPVQTPQPKADETFATFFADAKNRVWILHGISDTELHVYWVTNLFHLVYTNRRIYYLKHGLGCS